MSTGGNLVVPMVLWGDNCPTHCISAVLMTPDQRTIITGCNDGQLGIWDVTENWQIFPRSLLFGHTTAITCLALGSSKSETPYVVSASENGEMCLWDISDGRCVECSKLTVTHTNMQSYYFKNSKDLRLVCNGYYPEILIIDPLTFDTLYTLCSKVLPDWISACCVLRPVKREEDVLLAITNSGAVKIWMLTGYENRAQPVFEEESKQIRCLNAETLTCCTFNQRTVLIVCSKYWQIYDAGDFTLLCSESNRCGERWSGGDFISVDKVLVWSSDGKGYLYKLPTNLLKGKVFTSADSESQEYHKHSYQPSSPHAYYILDIYSDNSPACSPAMTFNKGKGDKASPPLLIRGDSEGQVTMWTLPTVSERQMTLVRQESFDRLPALPPKCSKSLKDVWKSLYETPPGIIDGFHDHKDKPLKITATIYVPSQGKVACGRSNGSIVIAVATQSIILQLLEDKTLEHKDVPLKVLDGHDGTVTTLLYPFNENTRYEPQHLLSGGSDFSVILWDMFVGTRLHTFTVHGGEITQLLVPPMNCNQRILTSICSVGSDHTVALLSLKERKCIMLAGRHLFPVQTIKWRPLDDFMVVSCSDGTVYVWQMETGHLDRVVHGITAEDILSNCDENAMPVDGLVNPNITLSQALKRRNLATFKNLAQQKLQTPGSIIQNQRPDQVVKPQNYAMYIQGVRTNTRDPDAHIIYFDTEALIVQLLTDEYAMMSPGELEAKGFILPSYEIPGSEFSDAQAKILGMLTKIKDKADSLGQKIQSKAEGAGFSPVHSDVQASPVKGRKKEKRVVVTDVNNLTLEIARLFMSSLHAWGLDPDLDKLCMNKLGLIKPKVPLSFGLISRNGHMCLMLPAWHRRLLQEVKSSDSDIKLPQATSDKPTLLSQIETTSGMYSDSDQEGESSPGSKSKIKRSTAEALQQELRAFSTKSRWQISSGVTTQHLLSVISTANTLMSMTNSAFINRRLKSSRPRRRSSKSFAAPQPPHLVEGGDSSEGGSEDETDGQMLHQAQIKQGWSLLAALHCVLLPEMVGSENIKSPQLEMLARRWQDRCLEIREAAQALLLAELRRIGPAGRKAIVDEWSPYLPTYVDPNLSLMNAETQKGGEEDDEDDNMDPMVSDSPLHRGSSYSFESRRKQATAIVMLGVIGAEFGHEIEPNRRKVEVTKKSKKEQEGFTLSNYSLSRHTSKALTFLLQQPPSRKLPAHTPIRRAAIDLIGRGFTVWEPYLDVSAVLLGLLELCVDSDRLVPRFIRDIMTFGLPLSPAADACRTARHALSLIATARPPAFIITMAKEVARFNAMLQTTQSQHSQIQNSVLIRAKVEILRIIELLVEKMPNDVADHLVEAMDVTIHCLDVPQLKSKGLQELFPAICRFSMVSMCPISKRIWVGAKNGGLAFYDLKQHSKCQVITAHSGHIVATAIAADGKHLATYSHTDNKLKFWQTASSSLFGIGSQQTKLLKQFATQPLPITNLTNLLKLVRLVWIDNRLLILLTLDGSEYKYSI
ncbi:WD repeat-containing protein 7-like isoform X1 [Mytilus trossulus]|uniref:WD repeat-containing protein 7-like isoform X1 n=1 Tax=Mytilus trossulus TaxID=6551 RepID=UPI00300595B6